MWQERNAPFPVLTAGRQNSGGRHFKSVSAYSFVRSCSPKARATLYIWNETRRFLAFFFENRDRGNAESQVSAYQASGAHFSDLYHAQSIDSIHLQRIHALKGAQEWRTFTNTELDGLSSRQPRAAASWKETTLPLGFPSGDEATVSLPERFDDIASKRKAAGRERVINAEKAAKEERDFHLHIVIDGGSKVV